MREIIVSIGPNGKEYEAIISDKGTGIDIRKAMIEQGVIIDPIWKLLGVNRNGTYTLIKDSDTPWHDEFHLMAHWNTK